MRIVITGGGTGGHIYPALEVGRLAKEGGAEIAYMGSLRGQESGICAKLGIPFQGFASEPLYSLRSIRGARALMRLQLARRLARKELGANPPDVVFSTGGYSAGPIVVAARDLRIPYVIHCADSVPTRSSALFARRSAGLTCTFQSTVDAMAGIKAIRTGHPIRAQMRAAAANRSEWRGEVLVLGGSQGSKFLNETMPMSIAEDSPMSVVHVCGRDHFEPTSQLVDKLGIANRYRVVPYLEVSEMIDAYLRASVVVGRSGGTLAELAVFGIPSVLIPMPTSANNHQFHNAMEFEKMDAATLLPQAEATPERLGSKLSEWLEDDARRETAARSLREWDIPDATERILHVVKGAAG